MSRAKVETPVLEMTSQPDAGRESLVQSGGSEGVLQLIERIALHPQADPSKLEKMIDLHERILRKQAESEFNTAFAQAQKLIRAVAADADNPQTRSRYATYAKLDRALRPIYTSHGFGLSFDTGEGAPAEHVRVICAVTHLGGHAKTYHIDMPADGKGARGGDVMTRTHAAGAAISYGMRYLLRMIFNVAVGEDDRDGNDLPREVEAPSGFADWWESLSDVADNGHEALRDAWAESPKDFCKHLVSTNREGWEALKRKAATVKPSTKEPR